MRNCRSFYLFIASSHKHTACSCCVFRRLARVFSIALNNSIHFNYHFIMSSVQHSATSAYLRLGNEYCLLCNAFITTSEKKKCCTFKPSGWVTLQNKAKEWALLCIPEEDKRHYFCKVHQKIHTSTEPFGIAHSGCRSYFLGKINKYERDFPKKRCS